MVGAALKVGYHIREYDAAARIAFFLFEPLDVMLDVHILKVVDFFLTLAAKLKQIVLVVFLDVDCKLVNFKRFFGDVFKLAESVIAEYYSLICLNLRILGDVFGMVADSLDI